MEYDHNTLCELTPVSLNSDWLVMLKCKVQVSEILTASTLRTEWPPRPLQRPIFLCRRKKVLEYLFGVYQYGSKQHNSFARKSSVHQCYTLQVDAALQWWQSVSITLILSVVSNNCSKLYEPDGTIIDIESALKKDLRAVQGLGNRVKVFLNAVMFLC